MDSTEGSAPHGLRRPQDDENPRDCGPSPPGKRRRRPNRRSTTGPKRFVALVCAQSQLPTRLMRPVLVECQVESVTVGGPLRSPQQSAVVVRRSRIHFDGPGNSRQPQISPHHVNLSYHAHTADLLRTPAPSTHQDRETLASEPPRCIVRSSNPGNCRLRSPADSGPPPPVGQRSAGRSRCRRDCAPRLARAKTTIRSTSSALFPFSSPNWIHAWAPRSARAEVVSSPLCFDAVVSLRSES